MGRPRKSNELKILHGDRPDRINVDEPDAPLGLGNPPDDLDEAGLRGWHAIDEAVKALNIAKTPDREAAIRYARAYSDCARVRKQIDEEGLMVETRTEVETEKAKIVKISRKANPLLPTLRQLENQMMRLMGQFGMTPASRAILRVKSDPAQNRLVKLMESRRGNREKKPS